MADQSVRLLRPNGKPYWLVYGVQRIADCAIVYVGRTASPLSVRWIRHGIASIDGKRATQFALALRREGFLAFRPIALVCCSNLRNAMQVEGALIERYGTLYPRGFNSAGAIKGAPRSAEFQARISAALKTARAKRDPVEVRATLQRASAIRQAALAADPEKRTVELERLRSIRELATLGRRRSWDDPSKRPRMIAIVTKAAKARAIQQAQAWSDPDQRPILLAKLIRTVCTPEAITKRAAARSRHWASMTPETRREKMRKATDAARRRDRGRVIDKRQRDLF